MFNGVLEDKPFSSRCFWLSGFLSGVVLAGVKNLRRFVYIADTEAGAREAFRVDVGINPVESAGTRMLTADLVACWHDARITGR